MRNLRNINVYTGTLKYNVQKRFFSKLKKFVTSIRAYVENQNRLKHYILRKSEILNFRSQKIFCADHTISYDMIQHKRFYFFAFIHTKFMFDLSMQL